MAVHWLERGNSKRRWRVLQEVIEGCQLVPLTVRGDQRGSLVAIEGRKDVPFEIARVYYVFGTKPGTDRGLHAHRKLRQVAVAVSGGCTMVLDNGLNRQKVRLEDPSTAVTIPPMIWHEMTDFTADCVLMVLADDLYDESDYIRDYELFLENAGAARA